MISELGTKPDGIRYLGLPGVDLLDLRYIHSQVCSHSELSFGYLGFNGAMPETSQHLELQLSITEIRELEKIDTWSTVLTDSFESISNTKSLAWRRTQDHGPYDVINLDLCDGFGTSNAGSINDNYYNAMQNLVSLQSRRTYPWLLFLTTRIDKPNISDTALERLAMLYKRNLDSCSGFAEVSQSIFDATSIELDMRVKDDASVLAAIVTIGLCKWFVTLVGNQSPSTKAELRSVLGYKVSGAALHDDLVSVAIRFSPQHEPTKDPVGLGGLAQPLPNECSSAIQTIKRYRKRKNVDDILQQDPALFESLVEEAETLLATARYDVTEYRNWVRDHCL